MLAVRQTEKIPASRRKQEISHWSSLLAFAFLCAALFVMVILDRINPGWLRSHSITQQNYAIGHRLFDFIAELTVAGAGLAVVSLLLKPNWRAAIVLILSIAVFFLIGSIAFAV